MRALVAQQAEQMARTRVAAGFAVADHEDVTVGCGVQPWREPFRRSAG
jgi:hypothetical protein